MARISVFGSTGSVGRSALDVVAHANAMEPGRFELVALTAGTDAAALADQARRFHPEIAVIADDRYLGELRERLAGTGIETAGGLAAMSEAAARPVKRLLAAIAGSAGLASTFAAVRAGNDVALANKESVVCAGRLLLREAAASGARILPVDSEHSAIFQCLGDGRLLESMTITASGGPFRTWTRAAMSRVTPDQAAAHPNWSMGRKISIDSATLMNKALEFIEAAVLFEVPSSKIDVLIHPQSILHGMAQFADGSVIAQLGVPDMRTPISLALGWPDRLATTVDRLDLGLIGRLDFERVDEDRFPSISLAKAAMALGPGGPVILNSVNEEAVSAFGEGRCGFLDITRTVATALDRFSSGEFASTTCNALEDIAFLDQLGRGLAAELLQVA